MFAAAAATDNIDYNDDSDDIETRLEEQVMPKLSRVNLFDATVTMLMVTIVMMPPTLVMLMVTMMATAMMILIFRELRCTCPHVDQIPDSPRRLTIVCVALTFLLGPL